MYISLHNTPPSDEDGERSAPRRVAPVVITLGLVSMLTDISSESISAILPLYLTAVVGLSTVQYGFIDGLYQGTSALVRIAGGWAADRGRHPKWVAFVGYGLSCITRLWLLLATGFAAITAVVSIDRIGKGIRTAPRDVMIAAATPAGSQAHAFGVHRMLDNIGAAVGPLLAFVLLWAIPDGYTAVMAVSLAFAVLGVLLLGLLVPDNPAAATVDEPAPTDVQPTAPAAPFRWKDISTPGMLRLLPVVALLGLLTVGDGFLYLALLDRGGLAAAWFPLLYVGTNIAFFAFAIPIGRLADQFGRAKVLVAGHVALGAAYLCAALPGSGTAVVILVLILLGLFYAATDGVVAAVAGTLVPASVRASGIATAQTTIALARMGASIGFGLLWFTVGPRAALVVVAVALTVVIVGAGPYLARLDTHARKP